MKSRNPSETKANHFARECAHMSPVEILEAEYLVADAAQAMRIYTILEGWTCVTSGQLQQLLAAKIGILHGVNQPPIEA